MMLFFFNRLTFGLYQQRLVKTFAGIAAISYLAVWLTITCGCHPIHLNWQMLPYPPEKSCQMKLQNFYVTTVLNVLTDALILAIPIPLLWGMRVSLSRKIALTVLLGSGIFVIIAAILRITFTLAPGEAVNALNINLWGTRETAVGIIAVNVPILRVLLRPSFWRHGFLSSDRGSDPQQQRKQQPGEKSTIGAAGQRRVQTDQMENFERQLRSWTSEKDVTSTLTPRNGFEIESHSERLSESPPSRRNAVCTENLGWDLERGFPEPGVALRNADDVYRIGPRPLLPEPESPTEPQPAILPGVTAPQLYRQRTWDLMPPIAEVVSKESSGGRRSR